MAVGYVLQGLLADAEFPFVANSVAKDGTFAILCIVAAADIRRHIWAVSVVIGAHLLIIGSLLLSWATGNASDVSGSFAAPEGLSLPDAEVILYIWLGLAIAVTGALMYCRHKAVRARFELKYLAPHQHRALMALAEVLVLGRNEALSPVAVAANVDDYLYSFPAESKSKAKLALTALWVYPMLRLRPPYPVMSPERRIDFIEKCFISDVADRRLPGPIRRLIQSILVAAQNLTFIGYYADERAAADTGYVKFSERDEGGPLSELAVRPFPPLNVRTPREVDADRITADVVIVGSGAAGAVLAKRLAEKGR